MSVIAEIPARSPADFVFANHGTITLLTPLTSAASAWVAENIPADAQRFGGAVVIEHRFEEDINAALLTVGFVVKYLRASTPH